NPNGAVLSGTLTRAAVNGVATFDDLKLDKAGTGYTLVATSGSLPSATSSAFNTTGGGTLTMAISVAPSTGTVAAATAFAPAVRIVDASNNPVAGVSVTFTPGTGSGTVAPAGGVAVTNTIGIASLTSWTLGTIAGAQTLVATSPGVN